VVVPSVVGLSKTDATARLQSVGLVAAVGDTPYSDTVTKDQVMDFSPKGDLEKGVTVTLIVSNGVRPIQLSDLSNMSYANAKAILDGLGLPAAQNQVYSDTVPAGNVVSTSPGPGPVPPGTTITVNVSKGPQIVTVPDLTNGMTVAQGDGGPAGGRAAARHHLRASQGDPRARHAAGRGEPGSARLIGRSLRRPVESALGRRLRSRQAAT